MVTHGNARKVYDGLYELVDDPREGDAGSDTTAEPIGDIDAWAVTMSFEKQLNDRRAKVIDEWLAYVRDHGESVKRSDFVEWWTDEHADRTGYSLGTFWEHFALEALRQADAVEQPNSRTYVWEGRE
jgi:hypothetical protein